MYKNIKVKEKEALKIFRPKKREYCLNQSWSKWKLLMLAGRQRNFVKK
jgi:hypothetical protein